MAYIPVQHSQVTNRCQMLSDFKSISQSISLIPMTMPKWSLTVHQNGQQLSPCFLRQIVTKENWALLLKGTPIRNFPSTLCTTRIHSSGSSKSKVSLLDACTFQNQLRTRYTSSEKSEKNLERLNLDLACLMLAKPK